MYVESCHVLKNDSFQPFLKQYNLDYPDTDYLNILLSWHFPPVAISSWIIINYNVVTQEKHYMHD